MSTKQRCTWAHTHQEMIDYHDNEWGKPQHDSLALFEMLNLEGAQAGLSWLTILKRREAYRKAFDGFNPAKMMHYDTAKRETLRQDTTIIRNRLKINAFIENAKAYTAIVKTHKDFGAYLWQFNRAGVPFAAAESALAHTASEAMSRQLKQDGFKFIGLTICYAFMQATGMINDHEVGCFLRTD